jgi:hypothetical protein
MLRAFPTACNGDGTSAWADHHAAPGRHLDPSTISNPNPILDPGAALPDTDACVHTGTRAS